MSKKIWRIFIARGKDGRFIIDVMSPDEELPKHCVFVLEVENRAAAIKQMEAVKRLSIRKKISLLSAAKELEDKRDALPEKLFRVVNEGFVCEHCGKEVMPTLHDGPRDHCPFCLYSKHVDINPGDRKNTCRGILRPIGIITGGKKVYVIEYICEKCRENVKAKAATKSAVQADSFDEILKLSSGN